MGRKEKNGKRGTFFHSSPVGAATSHLCCHRPPLPYAIVHRPDQPSVTAPSSSLLRVRSPSHAALAVLHRLPHPQHALGVSSLASSLLYGSLLCSSFSCTTPLLLDLASMPSSLARRPSPCSLSSVLANATRVPIGSLRHQHPPCPLFVPLHAPFPTSCHQSSL
jgi:hypothetical protein